ncbi:hypothetical protein T02_12304 [Trichinella nativa]|uniref:Uncharacterized protein n=1 Tax=Trichinella nativa TaxID=6335 RepID=A0A0V1LS26_9BILA|nr:hypothetical protein T02_12304 [Trichinella nativa]
MTPMISVIAEYLCLQFTRMLMRKFHSVSTHRRCFVFCRCKLPKFYDMQLKKNPSVLVEQNKVTCKMCTEKWKA